MTWSLAYAASPAKSPSATWAPSTRWQTGLLPLVLGNYTRLARYFGSLEKHYTGTIRFGFATDTYDAEGAPAAEPLVSVALHAGSTSARKAAHFLSVRRSRCRLPTQPRRSTAKPAYALARAGQTPLLKTARVTIEPFLDRSASRGDTAEFTMQISSGGYVRSVAHELGQHFGCGAHLSSLRRIGCRVRSSSSRRVRCHALEEAASAS